MAGQGSDILRSLHFKCSSPHYVADELEINMRLLGYKHPFPTQPPYAHNKVKPPQGLRPHSFLVSMLTGGWISIYNDSFFALEEVARRMSHTLGAKGLYLWADPEVSWGYSYYSSGQLTDEFCSGIEDLYESLFDSPPTPEERLKLIGEPGVLLDEFNNRTVTADYLKKLFMMDKKYAKGCMVKFAQIFGIQTAGRTFQTISNLHPAEKYDKERFTLYYFVKMGPDDELQASSE